MSNLEKRIESIKYRLEIINNQWKTKVIDDNEYNKLLLQLENEIRLLEDEVFNNIKD